ncbi:MAG: hypothetical protein BWK79_07220 [Beggiatoa sp. IS2]|nr:MAG: hypothetical protein BWK79_07220 [Beggiatoa sp. IS2]
MKYWKPLGLGAGIASALDPVGYANAGRINADLTYHHPELTSNWDVTTQLSYLDIRNNVSPVTFPPGAFGGIYPDGYIGKFDLAESHLRFDTFAFYSGLPQHLIRVGTGYHYNDQYKVAETKNYGVDPATGKPLPPGSAIVNLTDTPYVFNKETQRKNWYLSLQDVWTLTDQWELTAGIRYDNYSDFGSTINPRFALVWQTQPYFTSKLLYGRAFRTPSFADLYNTYNPIAMGNSNLKPETIDTWEIAFDYRVTDHFNLATNVFTYDIADKIRYTPTADKKTNVAQNIGNWKGHGLELEARWKISQKFNLMANYSYAKATNKSNDSDIGNYPRHSAYVRTDWLLMSSWYVDVQANWIADRQRVLNDPRPEIDDYTTVDLTFRYKGIQQGRAIIALSVRNLFDADAREPTSGPDSSGTINVPHDLPLAGRHWFVEFQYRF